ncbi:RNA exonuclease 1 homolog [Hippocampus comes]|uniref:RNA exonuclease 1 homolog n=1 Tax=Hippocampus comes TaxID=109280 RepID=UPI00094E014F|nr:PREDICTED: RNA exonuclease 1 homolog [Hippocampus comes]
MLRSTGFFRGLDCPFYTEDTEGKGSGNGCNRPYCHFRHSQQRRQTYAGATVETKKLDAAQKGDFQCEQGYDPFKPEVVRPQEHQNGTSPRSGDLTGALEMVNKAIEEVRNEVEREKKKLFRIGDESYNPSRRAIASSSDGVKGQAAATHLPYDPGSYQMTSGGYNPTPGCSKYTLDSDSRGSNSNCMEYVPTLLKKNPSRTNAHRVTSLPPSPKYSTRTSSSSCKYTLDTSRPSTDMEYDPLSNYSAGIAVKRKRNGSACNITVEGKKTYRHPASDDVVPHVRETPRQSVDTNKYTFSESDGESSGTEYKPLSLSSLQQRKANSMTKVGDSMAKERKEGAKGTLQSLAHRNKEHLETGERSEQKMGPEKKKLKIEKSEKAKVGHTSLIKKSSKDKGKESLNKSQQKDPTKKENKSHGKNYDSRKDTVKVQTADKVHKEHKKSDGNMNPKTNSSKRGKDTENRARESSKCKVSDKERSKQKETKHKNGQLDDSKRDKDGKKLSKSSSSSASAKSKAASELSKGKMKRSEKVRSLEQKERTLSHAELFGDESAEEAEPIVVDDSDDDPEEVLMRKSADALKRGQLNKRKASEVTPSSSEYEDDRVAEGSGTNKDAAIDLSLFQVDLDFDSDPLEECFRIFNESKDVKKEDKGRQAKQPSRDLEEDTTESTLTTLFPGQKKRVSHFAAKGSTDAPSKNVVRPYRRLTAQEVCYQRMQMAQQQAAHLSASVKPPSESTPSPRSSGEKKRIAHRPNPLTVSSKTSCSDAAPAGSLPLKTQTTAGILSKTTSTVAQKRVAHTPTMKSSSMKRPIIPMEFGAKIPTMIRQRYLNIFIDECIKFCPSEDMAFQMGLDKEKTVYERSNSKKIYVNVAVNMLNKLRNNSTPCSSPAIKEAGLPAYRKAQSHQEVLGGRLAATTSFTVNRMGKQQEEKLNGAALYRKLKAYLMTEEQLQEHGYPRINPNAVGKAVLCNLPEKKVIMDPFTKICCRCGAEYKVNAMGNCLRKEECAFHWGRLRRQKVAGGWETMYSCCAAAVGSPGCQTAQQHVQDGRKESSDGYVTTFSKELPVDGNGGVFALDCEMCYTKQGLELTRVTVINSDLKVIYDTFVKPESKVVDFNTRFSGVTAEDLDGATITLRDVQAVLLSLFSAESILVGHSLESDLLALKLIHSSVVDTAIVFPHRLGLPYKRALRNLMADYLKRIIQDGVDGHDSSEDATACMELMIWKLKEDAKVKR